MERQIRLLVVGVALAVGALAGASRAAERFGALYVVDAVGQLAQVDLADGSVRPIAQLSVVMTDIAFAPDGALYGLDFANLYAIDKATGAIDQIGPHGVSCGNALEITPAGDALVMGCDTTALATLALPSLQTLDVADIGAPSSGDLAASPLGVFMTVRGPRSDQLARYDPAMQETIFIGDLGFDEAYGLAWAPDGRLYAGAGGVIYEVDPETAKAWRVYDVKRGGAKLLGVRRAGLRDFYGWAIEPETGSTS